ncbi:MAG: LptF/LptG family permease [Candidatus Eisenbacteria bacterium]|nr:LptF/LptG family permease [Candidatus Eisenbacteria bacterium]
MSRLLERYVLRQLVRPFLLGAFVVTFLLTMDFLFDYLDLFLGKGIGLGTVLKLFFLGLGWMLALSVPCGVLVGVLMTYGRMAQDNEISAARSSGIHPMRIVAPTLVASALLAAGLAVFNDRVLPDMNHAWANLMLTVNRKRPTAEIQEGIWIDAFSGYKMFIGQLEDRTGKMSDIQIHDFSRKDQPPRTILAKNGMLEYDADSGILRLKLSSGEIHEAERLEGKPVYRKMEFESQTLNIQGSREALAPAEGRARGQREMSIRDMKAYIAELDAERRTYEETSRKLLEKIGAQSLTQLPGEQPGRPWYAFLAGGARPSEKLPPLPDSVWTPQNRRAADEARVAGLQARAILKRMDQFRVEIQKKISIPVACVVFVLVGAPLGVRARRGGLAAGFLSAGFFIFYYLCLVGGEQLADRGLLGPALAMWLPNVVLGFLGVLLTLRMCGVRLWPAGSEGARGRAAAGPASNAPAACAGRTEGE